MKPKQKMWFLIYDAGLGDSLLLHYGLPCVDWDLHLVCV